MTLQEIREDIESQGVSLENFMFQALNTLFN